MSNSLQPAAAEQDPASRMSILTTSQRHLSFEELPVEIHTMILHQMASPRDLSATFRASPAALGAFLSFREAILTSVFKRHISPEMFCHYVAVLTAPDYADFNFVAPFDPDLYHDRDEPYQDEDHDELRWWAWIDFACDLYKTRVDIASCVRSGGTVEEENRSCVLEKGRVPTEEEVETFKQQVQSLAVLYGTVERFTKDIQAFAFNVAEGRQADLQKLEFSNPPDDLKRWPGLSPSEQTRLQRGLLRYELCCRLFGSPSVLRWSNAIRDRDYSQDDPYEIIKHLLPSWELQEILVGNFLLDIQSLDKRSLGSASEVAKDANKQHAVATSKEPQCNIFTRWWDLKGTMEPSGHWVGVMSRLGLVVLQRTLRSGVENMPKLHGDMIDLTYHLASMCEVEPNVYEFNNCLDWIYPPGYWSSPAEAIQSLEGANPVFLAAQDQRLQLCDNSAETLRRGTIRLQELGWVFWEDRSRLSALHLPHHEDDEADPGCHLARHFRDDIARSIRYEVEGLLDQVEGAAVTNKDWNSIIAPKYGFCGSYGRLDFTEIKSILVDPSKW